MGYGLRLSRRLRHQFHASSPINAPNKLAMRIAIGMGLRFLADRLTLRGRDVAGDFGHHGQLWVRM
jgi:hypothetical protein